MDITKHKAAETAALHLKDADGELMYDDAARTKPVRIILHSPGSKAFGVVEARQSARVLKRMNENDGKIAIATHEERIAETAEDLAATTVAFENREYPPAGEKQGSDLFAALYADRSLGFIVKQVTKFLADW